jgi:hypothetical protein
MNTSPRDHCAEGAAQGDAAMQHCGGKIESNPADVFAAFRSMNAGHARA